MKVSKMQYRYRQIKNLVKVYLGTRQPYDDDKSVLLAKYRFNIYWKTSSFTFLPCYLN